VIRGYDVSHHQGAFDHARAKREGFDFCIVKATEGTTFRDPLFSQNWRQLGETGVARGAYHFGRPGSNSAAVEASHYLEVAGLGEDDIRPILDLEAFGNEALGPSALGDWVGEWIEEVRAATGKRAIIYTRRFWIDHLSHLAHNFDADLWIPRYSDAMLDPEMPGAWAHYLLWQWAGTSADEFFPHDIGPVRRKLGEVAQLNVAGRRVDQNVGREGTTVDDLVARPRRKRVERWVVNAVWDEEGRRQVAELFDPVRLERLDQAVGGHLDDIARHTHRGHRVIIKRVMVDA